VQARSVVTGYRASKAAVTIFMPSLGKPLGPHGIRVKAVVPRLIDTTMGQRLASEACERMQGQAAGRRERGAL